MSTPTMKKALKDCQSHYDAWREAMGYALNQPLSGAKRTYWEHEIKVFERTLKALAKPQAQPAPVPNVVLRDGDPTLLRDREIKTTDVRLCVIKENT